MLDLDVVVVLLATESNFLSCWFGGEMLQNYQVLHYLTSVT